MKIIAVTNRRNPRWAKHWTTWSTSGRARSIYFKAGVWDQILGMDCGTKGQQRPALQDHRDGRTIQLRLEMVGHYRVKVGR
jgi:hypothetical protein